MENEIKKRQTDLLNKLDDLEEQIKLFEIFEKEYKKIKEEIKSTMVKIGIENNLEQLKWTTPKGTKITCSIGHCAEFEKETTKVFDIEKLKKDYPDVYEKCLIEKETYKTIKNATNDTLRITLAKGE